MAIQKHPIKSKYCKLRLLCRSLAGNNVYCLTVTAPVADDELAKVRSVSLSLSRLLYIHRLLFSILFQFFVSLFLFLYFPRFGIVIFSTIFDPSMFSNNAVFQLPPPLLPSNCRKNVQ